MKKPRLLVLATKLPDSPNSVDLERALALVLASEVGGVEISGYCALPYSPESLLNWAVLGKSTEQDDFLEGIQKGCKLYVGIMTPEFEFASEKDEDGIYDIYIN